jgi:cytochrome c oxidase subunit 3
VTTRPSIDVSHLPTGAFDTRSPLWWGNLWLLAIESTMFAILVASYFYIRMNYHEWPPPRVNQEPVLYHTAPDLGIATANMVLLLLSCIPVIWMDRAARRKNQSSVQIGLLIFFAVGIASIILRSYEFRAVHFLWNENAYASVVWTVLGTHLLHLIVATSECLFIATFAFSCPLDESHALDVTVLAVYWYWVVGIWLLLYGIIYFGPRVM